MSTVFPYIFGQAEQRLRQQQEQGQCVRSGTNVLAIEDG
jgi:hypothetical protein